jgi:hypothetical protein
MTIDIVIVVSECIDNVLLKMVSPTETCKGWNIKKHNIYQSHWKALITFYTITSVTDQVEPSQIYFIVYIAIIF